MKPAVAVLYADASSAALVDAIRRWREEHHPEVSYQDLLALGARSIKIQTTLRPSGRAQIHVRIEGRRVKTDDDYWFEATLSAGELKLEAFT